MRTAWRLVTKAEHEQKGAVQMVTVAARQNAGNWPRAACRVRAGKAMETRG